MRDYLDRLDALVQTGVPDEEHTRGLRRDARHRPAHQSWVDAHHDEVAAMIERLVEQVDRVLPRGDSGDLDYELERVDELRLKVDRGDLSTGTMGVLSLALGELRCHPAVQALDRGHGLHRALREAERIRARYDDARTGRACGSLPAE